MGEAVEKLLGSGPGHQSLSESLFEEDIIAALSHLSSMKVDIDAIVTAFPSIHPKFDFLLLTRLTVVHRIL